MNLIQLDYDLTKKIATIIPEESPLRPIIRLFTHTGTFMFWMPALIVWYFVFPDNWQIPFLIAQTINMLMVQVLKRAIKRERPEFGDHSMGVVKFDIHSFPSGHSARAGLIMVILPLIFPQWTILWIIYAFALMVSRLLLGLHYVSDILAGLLLGLLSALLLLPFSFFAPLFG